MQPLYWLKLLIAAGDAVNSLQKSFKIIALSEDKANLNEKMGLEKSMKIPVICGIML